MNEKSICKWWKETDLLGWNLALQQGFTPIEKSYCEYPYECTRCLEFQQWEAEQDVQDV